MKIYDIFELIFLVLFTLILLRRFASVQISIGIKLLVYFSWALSFSIVILVPVDVFNVIFLLNSLN